MNWEDECYLLAQRKFRENAKIIDILSQKKGKVSGIVYGGNSRKIRNYLQISNKLFVINNSKSENKIGYFKTELIKPISPNYFNDKERTAALISLCSLLNLLLPDSQVYTHVYKSFENFVNSLNLDNWIVIYLYLEITLIKELGYDTNLKSFINKIDNKKDFIKINIDGFFYEVPNFLINEKIPKEFKNTDIKKSLIFTRSVFMNKFFISSKIKFPKTRILLEKYFS